MHPNTFNIVVGPKVTFSSFFLDQYQKSTIKEFEVIVIYSSGWKQFGVFSY